MASVAGLVAWMGLVTMVAGLHTWAVRPGRECIVLDVAMAINAQSFFLGMKPMGDLHNSHVLQVGLLAPGDGPVAAETVIVRQVVAGRKLAGDNLSPGCVATYAGHGSGMDAGREPHRWRALILVAAQAEEGVGGSEPDEAQAGDGC